jgi:hypothetical protein
MISEFTFAFMERIMSEIVLKTGLCQCGSREIAVSEKRDDFCDFVFTSARCNHCGREDLPDVFAARLEAWESHKYKRAVFLAGEKDRTNERRTAMIAHGAELFTACRQMLMPSLVMDFLRACKKEIEGTQQ